MTQLDLVRELRGALCHCGRPKTPGHSFCAECYKSLPREMQTALYKRVGTGYEEAYDAATRVLNGSGRSKGVA
jgi:hypothetical protein